MKNQEQLLAEEMSKTVCRIGDENVSVIWANQKSIKNFLDHGSYIGLVSRLKGSDFAENLRKLCSSSIRGKVLEGSKLLHELFESTYDDANNRKMSSTTASNPKNMSMSLIGTIEKLGPFLQRLTQDVTDNIRSAKESDYLDSAERFRDAYQLSLSLITVYLSLGDRKNAEATWYEASACFEDMYQQRQRLVYHKYPLRSPATFQFLGVKDEVFVEVARAISAFT